MRKPKQPELGGVLVATNSRGDRLLLRMTNGQHIVTDASGRVLLISNAEETPQKFAATDGAMG